MPPIMVTKKAKTKKQKSAVPPDLEFMLGEEILSPLDSPLSPTEAEYSLLTASPRDVLENLRLVGLAGNNTSSGTRTTSSSNSGQRDELVTSINNYMSRFVPEVIPEKPESQTGRAKSKSKRKTTQKKLGQLDRRIDQPEDVSGPLCNELTINSSDHPTYVVRNLGNRNRSTEDENRSNRDATNDDLNQHVTNIDQSASDVNESSTQSIVPSNISAKPSNLSKAKKSSDRRKSSPPKKNTSSSSRPHARLTIGNDQDINILRDIARLRASTECLIPKLPFARLIRETMQMYCGRNLRITPECLLCLQEAAEIYAVQVMEDAYRCTLHRGRITLTAKDMKLALLLRNDSVMMNM